MRWQERAALATSQDHKRLKDGDEGPNTGGMGAYSPAPVVTPRCTRAMREIILPTVAAWKRRHSLTGFLYAGLMIDAKGQPKTLEFNCRMGDPKRSPSSCASRATWCDLRLGAAAAASSTSRAEVGPPPALGVVMAATATHWHRAGRPITGLPADADDLMVFHAGTQLGRRLRCSHQRWPRAVRDGAGRQRQAGAAWYDPWRAVITSTAPVPPRHRPPRHQN